MGLVRSFRGLIKTTSFNITPSSVSVKMGTTYEIPYIVLPENATNQKVKWTSSNTNIATVSNGIITPVAIGTATITGTTEYLGFTDTVSVEVYVVPVTGVSLNESSITVNAGETFQLEATITPADAGDQRVIWSSSNTGVATVSSNGLITYVGDGNATITVTTVDGGYTATCNVVCVSAVYIRFLLVGGGGGGSHFYGGGGGAGGVIQCSSYCMARGSYNVVIGAGGNAVGTSCNGGQGGNSTALGLTAYGGGYGGGSSQKGGDGGSGGGAGYIATAANCIGYGCTGQGYNGGCSVRYGSGGGGGAGGVGATGTCCYGGQGGNGIQSDISGTNVWYAGGGSAMSGYGYCTAANPKGGTASANTTASNSTVCGGGGGANSTASTSYGAGGRGVFIVSYSSSRGYNITGGTKYLCNGNCIHCFCNNGTLVVN